MKLEGSILLVRRPSCDCKTSVPINSLDILLVTAFSQLHCRYSFRSSILRFYPAVHAEVLLHAARPPSQVSRCVYSTFGRQGKMFGAIHLNLLVLVAIFKIMLDSNCAPALIYTPFPISIGQNSVSIEEDGFRIHCRDVVCIQLLDANAVSNSALSWGLGFPQKSFSFGRLQTCMKRGLGYVDRQHWFDIPIPYPSFLAIQYRDVPGQCRPKPLYLKATLHEFFSLSICPHTPIHIIA